MKETGAFLEPLGSWRYTKTTEAIPIPPGITYCGRTLISLIYWILVGDLVGIGLTQRALHNQELKLEWSDVEILK